MCTLSSSLAARSRAAAPAHLLVEPYRLHELVADGEGRDRGWPAGPGRPWRCRRPRIRRSSSKSVSSRSRPSKRMEPPTIVRRRRGEESQDGQRADCLATARLTHQPDDLARPDIEGHVVDDADAGRPRCRTRCTGRGPPGGPRGPIAPASARSTAAGLTRRSSHRWWPALALDPRCRCDRGRRPAHRVPQGVADGVEGQHREGDGESGRDQGPRVREERGVVRLLEHGAPAGRRRRRSQAQESSARIRPAGRSRGRWRSRRPARSSRWGGSAR